ncbi:SCO family protein [uncultured Pseudoteredinibacter sp.]|uniref:SCO family protein n=1 Tax=uncultured Pseudoteredinibacter sp. TaxID=1641701 RepID=UPI00263617C6|nr:SCO family protein [uncultured Pseudoteredinibacter sp.]
MSEVSTDNNESLHTEEQRSGIIKTVVAIVVAIAVMLMMFIHKINSPRVLSTEELRINGLFVLDQPRILSDFELQNHRSEAFNRDSLKGKWSLVFFGFTHCPDICPTTMALLNQLVTELNGDILDQTQVVMVTADPARDSIEKLAEYVPFFNPDFIGVTGEFITLKKLGNQLNVPFVKVPQGDSYTVDHGGQVVIINPRGDYHGFLSTPLDLARMKLTYQSMVTASTCCGQ